MNVVRGHGRNLEPGGHLGEHIIAEIIFRHSVMPQFDPQTGSEHITKPPRRRHGFWEVPALGGPGYGSLPATGQRIQVARLGCVSNVLPCVHGTILLSTELRLRDETTDRPVPARPSGEQDQMVRVGKIGGFAAVHAHAPPAPLRVDCLGDGSGGPIGGFCLSKRVVSRLGDEMRGRVESDLGAVYRR